LQLTRVRSDVFPEPLGPIRRMEGKVVRPLAWKTTVWRNIGIVRRSSAPTTRPIGGSSREA
jgi:hypothetical protein